jgi:hypothetical protein
MAMNIGSRYLPVPSLCAEGGESVHGGGENRFLGAFFVKKRQRIKRNGANKLGKHIATWFIGNVVHLHRNCMAGMKQYSLWTTKSDGFNGENSPIYCGETIVRKLIILQLEAALPASLPFDIIFRGVACGHRAAVADDVSMILRELMANKIVTVVSECGFCDRFRLVEPHQPGNVEDCA